MDVGTCSLRKVNTCSVNDGVDKIAQLLKKTGDRHVIVLDGKKPVGIISVTDIVYRLVAEDKDASDTKAKDIMTSKIMVRDASEKLTPAYVDMIKHNIYGCVITSKGTIRGMLDLREAMNCLVKAKAS